MSSSLDLASALDYVLADPNTEAKFQALKTLHSKKIKSLMNSIEAKEREVDRLKVLGKDNRRTEIIQSLKKKLKHHELVISVMKEQLMKYSEMTKEEVNQLVIDKTISGPKRFRPLIREELENQISELERKLELERKMRSKMSATSGGTGGGSVTKPIAKSSKSGGSVKSGAGGDSSGGEKTRSIKEEELNKMIEISELQDQIMGLNQEVNNRNEVIAKQKEEIIRLRSVNATMHGLEEEIDTLDRSYKELTLVHQRTLEDLDDSVSQLSVCQEEKFQIQATIEQDMEQANVEIENLRDECQKSLKQNAQLLRLMSNMESKMTKTVSASPSKNDRNSSPARGSNPDVRLTEKLKIANARIVDLESEVSNCKSSLQSLREKLRDKNDTIATLKRDMTELSRRIASSNSGTKNNTNMDAIAEAKSNAGGTLTPRERDSKSNKSSPRSS